MIKKSTLINIIIFFLFFIYFGFILNGTKHFEVWSQITSVLQNVNNIDIKTTFSPLNAHTLRLSLLFPVMYVASYFDIDANNLFSWILYVLIIVTFLNINKVNKYYSTKKYNSVLISFILLILTMFMNGRGVIGFFCMSLLLRFFHYVTQKKITIKRFFITSFFILYFSSISSGVFFVSLCSIITFFFFEAIQWFPKIKKKHLQFFILIPAIIISFSPFISIYWNKNINFYSGSVVYMLDHGLGVFFKNYYVLCLLTIFITGSPILMCVFYLKIKKSALLRITSSIILSSFLVGLFGRLSGMMSIIPFLVIFSHFFQRIKISTDAIAKKMPKTLDTIR